MTQPAARTALEFLCTALCASAFAGYSPVSLCPDWVRLEDRHGTNALVRQGGDWILNDVRVTFSRVSPDEVRVSVASPSRPLELVRIGWRIETSDPVRMFSEPWGPDLGWNPLDRERTSGWFFLLNENGRTHGWGVKTQPNAIAFWRVASDRITLALDLSAAGDGVRLGGRTLEAVTLVSREGGAAESPYQSARAFCRLMCPHPRLPREPVFGYNDWYCAYGANTATNFLADAAFVVSLAKGLPSRPFVVMDDGWQENSPPVLKVKTGEFQSGWGPWDRAGTHFGMEMEEFAGRIAALGAKPGLWYRPLHTWSGVPERLKLKGAKGHPTVPGTPGFFDPTLPEVKAMIAADIGRFRRWGFRLVKCDYISYDVFGKYFFRGEADERLFTDSREWSDRSRTTAEVMLDLYRTIRAAAGDDMVVIGCNAFNHLVPGLFEIQRTGHDTSGWKWEKTAKFGPEALGTRAIFNGVFYAADPDCIGLAEAGAIPWEKNRQWLDAVARSHQALFISWRRQLSTAETGAAFRRAFATAAAGGANGEPLDWMDRTHCRRWRFADGEAEYDWFSGFPIQEHAKE